MRVLILSISAGGGHTHAAEAIKTYVMLNNPDSVVKTIDTLKYINPLLDKVVIGTYLKSIKFSPSIFGKLYRFSEKDEGLVTLTNKINEIVGHRIISLIKEFKPDIIIATHPFSTQMLSVLKTKYELKMPSMAILTDYSSHNFWIHPHIDAYIVSSKDMKTEMIEKGINENSIYEHGIPVDPGFIRSYNRTEIFSSIDLLENIPTILIMGGTLGMGKIASIYEELSKLESDIQIVVIAGKNKKLYNEISKLKDFAKNPTVLIGYTKEVSKYMQACDLLLTKPGGLTITEAMICQIPLVLISPIPGQEEKNIDFLIKHNLALRIDDDLQLKTVIQKLVSDPNYLGTIKNNYEIFAKPNAGNEIYNLMKELVNNKK